jgi:prephenate dehydrogenase
MGERFRKRFLSPAPLIIPLMRFEQITIVGVGLIGGSIGLAAKARGLAGHVVGIGRDARTLTRAVELQAIDSFTTDLAEAVGQADLVVVCTPVDRIADMILRAAPRCRPGTIFTDAGSTKGNIVAAVMGKLPRGVTYVPAHPLAGAEKNGVEHARADLFENRVTIVTPETVDPDDVARVESFWRALGSRVVSLSVADHDRVLASTSHLPHAVAATVAGITPRDWLPLSAGGFRDVTRIAAGDPELWAAIFQANRAAVLAALRAFSDRLNDFRQLLEAGDGAGLVRWLNEAKQVRDALGS